MFKEFTKFLMRGNVIDLAVGIIIGSAFTGVVQSLVNDIIMPPIGYLVGGVDFSALAISLSEEAAINYGMFINTLINFLIVGFAVFMLIRGVNALSERFKREEAQPEPEKPAEPTTEERLVTAIEALNETLAKMQQ